jgi:thioredoxin-dependent peroxiredoxin
MYTSLVSRSRALLLTVSLALACSALHAARAATDPSTGTPAPAFRLQDQHDAWISLADQKGKWLVLYFYPMDETPGCTTEACEFRDNIFAYRRLGVNVLGISVQDVASKKQFATKHSLPFSVLADTDKSVAKAYGVLSIMGFARRETFIIDPSGRIAKHYPKVDPQEHSKELLLDLKGLIKPAS